MEPREPVSPYEKLSPLERNQELGRVFNALPRRGRETTSDTSSEGKKILVSSLQELLGYSRVTSNAQRAIASTFETYFRAGVSFNPDGSTPKEIAELKGLYLWGEDGNAGIFAESTAEPIELQLYNEAIVLAQFKSSFNERINSPDIQAEIQEKKTRFLASMEGVEVNEEELESALEGLSANIVELKEIINEKDALFATWRNAYIEKYGDEPRW